MQKQYFLPFLLVCVCVCVCSVTQSCATLCNPMDLAQQAPLSMEFSRQEFWSRLSFPTPGDLLDPVLMYSFPSFEPVHFSMSDSNCCFLICIQASQKACKVAWYSPLFKNFPQFVVIHTFKGFGIVNKTETDVFFLELSCFFDDPTDIRVAII